MKTLKIAALSTATLVLGTMKTYRVSSLLLLVVLSSIASAQELLKTETSWNGGTIAYPQGQAEITSTKVTLAEGQATNYHCHPVPTMAYILEGTLKLETLGGKKYVLEQGDALLETMYTVHWGTAVGGPVQIVVFYAGATSVASTVVYEADADDQQCSID